MKFNPIEEGIKRIGVGKNTTKSCSSELVDSILQQLDSKQYDSVQLATFLGALKVKGPSDSELPVVDFFGETYQDNFKLIRFLQGDLSAEVESILNQLLENKTFPYEEALILGHILFSPTISDSIKALAAVVLRMRYTSVEEYEAILKNISKTFNSVFVEASSLSGLPQVQISEPFDGNNRSYLVSPLYSYFLSKNNFLPILNSGHSSGPKFGVTVLSMKEHLNLTELNSAKDLSLPPGPFGFVLEQEKLSSQLVHWQNIRKKMIKRPFLATLEKYVRPFNTDCLVMSSFHDTFHDKSLEVAIKAGFQRGVNLIGGVEGGCGFSLFRKAKVKAYVKNGENIQYLEKQYTPADFNINTVSDYLIKNLTAEENARLILEYAFKQKTDVEYFDIRAQFSLHVLEDVFKWLYPEKKIDFFKTVGEVPDALFSTIY